MESNDNPELENTPIGYAFNILLRRDFPYFEERNDAILVERLSDNTLVWSPKTLWEFNRALPPPLFIEIKPEQEPKLKIRIRDKHKFWQFLITENEYILITNEKKLSLFWNNGWKFSGKYEESLEKRVKDQWQVDLKTMRNNDAPFENIQRAEKRYLKALEKAKKETKRRLTKRTYHRGWCLVTPMQRSLLLNGINYDEHPKLLMGEGGSSGWSEWSSIQWVKEQEWREYKRIKRTPVLSLKHR